MHRIASFFILSGFCFWMGCTYSTTKTNGTIDSESRTKIKNLTDRLIVEIYRGDVHKVTELYSDTLKKKFGNTTAKFVATIKSVLISTKYTFANEYLASNSEIGKTGTIDKKFTGGDYILKFPTKTKETYIALVVPEGKENQVLLTCIYGKFGEDWKLTALWASDYSFYGKNALEYYKQAQEKLAKGNLVEALSDANMSELVLSPAGEYFIYLKNEEIKAFVKSTLNKTKKKLHMPLDVGQIKTVPKIFNLGFVPTKDGICPIVAYVSKVNFSDTIALKDENNQLKEIIRSVLPGVTENKKCVYFRAYSELPEKKKEVNTYTFMVRPMDTLQTH